MQLRPRCLFQCYGSFFSLLFNSAFSHFCSGNEGGRIRKCLPFTITILGWSERFSAFTVNPLMFSCLWLDGIIRPPPTSSPLWDFHRMSSSAITGKIRNFTITTSLRLWKWMSGSQSISGASVWSGGAVWSRFRVWLMLLTHFPLPPLYLNQTAGSQLVCVSFH